MTPLAVSKHSLASRAGADVLARGGNAFDAAATMGFMLAVVEPYMSGIGGGKFQLVGCGAGGDSVAIDAPVIAPLGAAEGCFEIDPEVARGLFGFMGVKDRGNEIGHRAIAVPGVLAGLELTRQRFGTWPLEAVTAPAITRAEDGHALSWLDIGYISASAQLLARFPASAAIFLPGGRAPSPVYQHGVEPAPTLVQTDLARSLRQIAAEGAAAVYQGSLGEAIVAEIQANGGWLAHEDLERYAAHEGPVTAIRYRGWQIETGRDTEVLEALLILQHFELTSLGHNSASALHLLAEACRLAHADFYRYMTGPADGPPPSARLQSAHVEARAGLIQIGHAMKARLFPDEGEEPGLIPAPGTTTSYLAADALGNVVAALQTHGHVFGSGVTVPGTGIMLNDQMMGYDPQPGRRASVGPGRERSTSGWPVMATAPNGDRFALAAPGGNRVLCALVQAVVNLVDFGLDITEALRAPRIDCGSTPGSRDVVVCDQRIPAGVRTALIALGHPVRSASNDFAAPGGGPLSFATPAGLYVDAVQGTTRGGNDPFVPGGVATGTDADWQRR